MSIDKTIAPNIAAKTYAQNNGLGTSVVSAADDQGVKFSSLVEDKVQGAIDTVRAGETMTAKAIIGEAGMTEVVQAVTDADVTVMTAKALIDRMISAYQEIMRLPI